MTPSWQEYFIGMANLVASKSKDPRAKVGVVIVDSDNNPRATGFNGFPRGVNDDPERYNNQELKLALTVHSEANAIAAAARSGVSLKNCIAVVTKMPCVQCASLLIQAGIVHIIAPHYNESSSWAESHRLAEMICKEAGVKITYY
jgi:dCMP deaminase